ncbi:MAG: ABC transporter ATP-binding protein [Gaiella sp.]|nr:ABC transporter ATP-binding protein [Gaiella sp.]
MTAGSASSGGAVSLRRVRVTFDGTDAVADASVDIAPGEFVCLLGPSGCGKSTLLNVVAGFVAVTDGEALVDGQPVRGPDVSRGMVFQSSDALFPWLRVSENIAFGPRMRRVPKGRRDEIVARYVDLVGLAHAADRFPPQLSGGMKQRVQIARVLANEPSVVLMDEPFGALDAQTREVMQREVERIWQETHPTILFVTHDIDEAVLLADRVLTMTAGPSGRIKSEYRIELPRPRDETSEEAIELHRALRNDIAVEVSKTLRTQERMAG